MSSTEISELKTRRLVQRTVIGAMLGLPLAYSLLLIGDVTEWIRGFNEWRWHREMAPVSALWAAPILLVVVWLAWVQWSAQPRRRVRMWLLCASAVLMTGVLPFVALIPRGQPLQFLIHATSSELSSGFFGVGARIEDPNLFLANHLDSLATYKELHVQTSPPGNPLFFWGFTQFAKQFPGLMEPVGLWLRRIGCNPEFEHFPIVGLSSLLVQLSLPFAAGLGVLPLTFLVRDLYGRRPAFWVAGLFPLLPGISSFAPNFNLLYLTLCLTSLALAWAGFRRRSLWILALDGALLSVASFLNFGNLAFVPLNIAMLAAWWAVSPHRRRNLASLLASIAVLTASVSVVWVAYWRLYGVSAIDLYRGAIGIHQTLDRTYWKWVLYNPYDVGSWAGLALWAPHVLEMTRWRFRSGTLNARLRSGTGAALLGFLVALNLSGMVLGETARIMLFVAPLLLMVATGGAARLGRSAGSWMRAGLGLQALVVILWLWPIQTQWRGLPYVAPLTALPADARTVDYTLSNAMQLAGYVYDGEAGQITLYWRSVAPIDVGYTVFVHALDKDGVRRAAHDAPAAQNIVPTYCWRPGEIVADTHPLDLEPGTYDLFVGMYHWPELERLPVTPPQPGDIIPAGEIHR